MKSIKKIVSIVVVIGLLGFVFTALADPYTDTDETTTGCEETTVGEEESETELIVEDSEEPLANPIPEEIYHKRPEPIESPEEEPLSDEYGSELDEGCQEDGEACPEDDDKVYHFTEDEQDLLLRIGMCEAGAESVRCIAMIMRVVINRVESSVYPDDIRSVIFQRRQFTPVDTGWIYSVVPSKKCYTALEMVESGWDGTQGALAFECIGGNSWHNRNLTFLYEYDGVYFYK